MSEKSKTSTPELLKKNQVLECEIVRTGYNCEGIALISGIVIFVEGALPEEKVLIKIIKVTKKFAVGKLLKVIVPSPNRIKPVCGHSQCGGCQLTFVDYEYQLELKKNIIKSAFKQNAKIESIPLQEFIKSGNRTHYRNKVIMPFSIVNNNVSVGFYAMRSHRVINTEDCVLQPEISGGIVGCLKKFIEINRLSVYDENTGKGLFRNIMIRVNRDAEEIMTVLIINGDDLPRRTELINLLISFNRNIKSIILCKNKSAGNVVISGNFETIYGNDYITAKLLNNNFLIGPDSFFQVNYEQTEKLYKYIFDKLSTNGKYGILFDVYSGVSSIGVSLAGLSKIIYCIESNPKASMLAEKIIKINNISNIKNISGDSSESIKKLLNSGAIPDAVILDPPRKGCGKEELAAIAEKKVRRIIYVSYNPAT
ncbi:MAG TPA: 23S rRNA (uracil(1939)-C(5))-methyltransferase RlmD, partial [bacterium]|nr:23S rRNA (uracil(1939)-C(5))-methyltransferase RlmD [bacterium]